MGVGIEVITRRLKNNNTEVEPKQRGKVAAEDVPIAKPDPVGYLLTAKLVGERIHAHLKPADCLIIEDAPTVIRSVRKVGFSVLAVANSYPLEELGDANYVVKHLHPREVHGKIPGLKLGI